MQSTRNYTKLLLIALLPLGLLAAWTSKHLTLYEPNPVINIADSALVAFWSNTGMNWRAATYPRTSVVKLDLLTGKRSESLGYPSDFMRFVDGRNRGYEVRPAADGAELIDRDLNSGSVHLTGALPYMIHFSHLLKDRYLLAVDPGVVIAADTQKIDALGNVRLSRFAISKPVPASSILSVVENTPYFLCCCTGITPAKVKALTIDAGEIKEVASWPVGGSQPKVIVSGREIISLAPDSLSLEVRSIDGFEVVEKRGAAKEVLANWQNISIDRSTLSFIDPGTRTFVTCKLSDFTPIRELDGLRQAIIYLPFEQQATSRLTLFKRPGPNLDLTVYDADAHKIVAKIELNHPFNYAFSFGRTHVIAVDNRWGGTITVFAVPESKIVAIRRPMLWPLVAASLLCALTIAWCTAWLRHSSRRGRPLAIDWALLTAVLVLPSLYRMISFDAWYSFWRFPVALVQAAVVTSLFALGCYWMYGRIRWSYRALAMIVMLCLICLAIKQLDAYLKPFAIEILGQACLHFMVVGVATIFGAKITGVGLRQALQSSQSEPFPLEQPKRRLLRLSIMDWFLLTSAIALLLAFCAPFKEHIKLAIELGWLPALVVCSQVVVPQIVAARLLLSERTGFYRAGLALLVLAATVVVIEWPLVLLATDALPKIFLVLVPLRLVSLVYLLAGAWCWRLRSRLPERAGLA